LALVIVRQADGRCLHGDAALLFDLQEVGEELLTGELEAYDARCSDQAVRERGLAVVDVGDNAYVSDQHWVPHRFLNFVDVFVTTHDISSFKAN
jgi:hypothetical protein